MKLLTFLKSPLGNLTLFTVVAGTGGLLAYQNQQQDKTQRKELTPVEARENGPLHTSITREATPFKPAAAITENGGSSTGSSRRHATEPKAAKLPPLSLIAVAKVDHTELSKTYAPYGRMIPCETIVTLESSKLDTPVIGLVTEDVWHNGRKIIPAGAEVHGRAQLDRSRERIAAGGRWVVVWRDATAMNGTELVLNGIALEREKNDANGEFGLRDGSAGLIGELIRTDSLQEVRLFASTFLAGMAEGLQPTQTQTTGLGVTQITSGSTRDAALHGSADVLNAYARQIQEAIARDGFFVRVPAGKQFYLYVTETIDQARATRGNRGVEQLWNQHEN
jgi:hypothetical protein